MADIFGKTVSQYKTLSKFEDKGILDEQLQARCEMVANMAGMDRNVAMRKHDFHAFNFSDPESVKRYASGALGYVTNNFQAFVSMTDEIWYRKFQLNKFVPVINGGIAEGADTFAVVVKDSVGRGRVAGRYSGNAPTVDSNQRKYSASLYLGEIDARYTEEDMRNSLMIGQPLQESKIEDAVKGANNHLEIVGFTGDEDIPGSAGIFNQPTTGAQATATLLQTSSTLYEGVDVGDTWSAGLTAEQKAGILNAIISRMIVDTNEIVVEKDGMGDLCIVMPPAIYNDASTLAIGDDANKTVMEYVKMHNPYTNRTKRPLMFESLSELSTAGTAISANGNTTNRIAVYYKDTSAMEMRIVFAPRIIRVVQHARETVLPYEYKFSTLQVKRNNMIYYLDNV